MKAKLALMSLIGTALVAVMFTAAPVPQAAAFEEAHNHDPCYHTREHYGDNEDFEMFEEMCDEAVWALRARKAGAEARCSSIVRDARRDVRRACRRHCRTCRDRSNGDCRETPQTARTAVRVGQNKLSKCTWDAHADFDETYEAAREALEASGYNCLVQKLYVEYQSAKRMTVRAERRAYTRIQRQLRECRCNG